jgi:hypothetical protein
VEALPVAQQRTTHERRVDQGAGVTVDPPEPGWRDPTVGTHSSNSTKRAHRQHGWHTHPPHGVSTDTRSIINSTQARSAPKRLKRTATTGSSHRVQRLRGSVGAAGQV